MKQNNSRWFLPGLAGISFGTIIAILTIPEDPYPTGNLKMPALILSAGLMATPIFRGYRSFESALRTENVLCLGFIYWLLLDLIQGAYPLYGASREAIVASFGAIGLTATAVWIGSHGRQWPLPSVIKQRVYTQTDGDTLVRLIIVFFFLGMFKFLYACDFNIIEAFNYLGRSRWAAPWSRGQLGGWDAFLDHMQYFGYVLPTLLIILSTRRGWMNPTVLFSLVLTVIMLMFLSQGGGRRIIGVTVGSALISWMLIARIIKLRRIVVVVFFVTLLLIFMQFMLVKRAAGIFKSGTYSHEQLFEQYQYLHVDDNFFRLAQILDIIPKEMPFVYEKQILYTLARPVPRVFWPGKPIDPGFNLPKHLGKSGVSLSTSVIGEFYLSWGWIMVFLGGWFYGKLGGMLNHLLDIGDTRNNPIIYSLGVMVLFSGLRSMQDLVIMSYGILAWLAITSLPFFKHRMKKIDKISTH